MSKMINITVKTLDSQNHSFTVDDDTTVEQFKAHIADTVNIPADTQRIIYCGRVLQDNSKLNEYDVDGKVVHLVQRPPPSANQRANRPASPRPRRRFFREMEHGNAMYFGSMAFPSNLMESRGIEPPPPTHSLAGSRLNVARRMLRKTEQVIRLLENPSARTTDQPPAEEPQDEVTPVIEARVFVPSNNSEPIDEAMVLSAFQNSLLNDTEGNISGNQASGTTNTEGSSTTERETLDSSSNLANSSENLPSDNQADSSTSSTNTLAENASRTTEMADLLTWLNQLQARFAPFLQQYQNFMQNDPSYSSEEEGREAQIMFNRVSEVLHFLGHAYHSLSDIIIKVRTPPPRPLLCRPILIQHATLVQAGIPIQVEAQINIPSDRPSTSGSAEANTTTEAVTSETSPASGAPSTTSTTTANANPQVQTQVVGIPFIPMNTVQVQSFPLEIRSISMPQNSNSSATSRPQNNNNNTDSTQQGAATDATPNAQTAGAQQQRQSGQGSSMNFGNPNVEFFMEVTPEGITIDSLEPTLIGSNQANDLLRGALNGQSPDFLQSIMQMAGQIINRTDANSREPTQASASSTQASTTQASAASTQASASSTQASAGISSGQNSQARGNTQTHPTTATHTRSTSRPHVHLHQQAMQGGFDPFLPCNSHHVTRRRHGTASSTAQSSRQQDRQQQTETANAANPIYNIMNGIINSIRTVYQRRVAQQQQQSNRTPPQTSGAGEGLPQATPASDQAPTTAPPLETLFSNSLNRFFNVSQDNSDRAFQGPTIAQLLHQLPPDVSYVQGESILTDLIILLSRNLTIGDVLTLNAGQLDPLNRMRTDLQNFFLTRVLDGETGPEAIDRGIERILTEMQPFFEYFSHLQVRNDIDIVASIRLLFRTRLPNILSIASNLTNNSLRTLVDQFVATVYHLCALTLHASANGIQGVEQVFEHIGTSYMQGIPADLQNWTLMTSRAQLRRLMSNINVPQSTVEEYVVKKSGQPISTTTATPLSHNKPEERLSSEEPMDLDDQEAGGSGNEMGSSPPLKLEDAEPLPSVVIGSEPWHGNVPAEWVPIIARDAQRQRRQSPQPPFSDAYLSGMPSKRRKILNSSKPQGSLPQVISDSVRRAVTATGLTSAASLEIVAQAAGASTDIQIAYRNMLRNRVQAALRNNEDFTPERFPNASHYFNQE